MLQSMPDFMCPCTGFSDYFIPRPLSSILHSGARTMAALKCWSPKPWLEKWHRVSGPFQVAAAMVTHVAQTTARGTQRGGDMSQHNWSCFSLHWSRSSVKKIYFQLSHFKFWSKSCFLSSAEALVKTWWSGLGDNSVEKRELFCCALTEASSFIPCGCRRASPNEWWAHRLAALLLYEA